MYASLLGGVERRGTSLHIFGPHPCEAADGGAGDLCGNGAHRLEVAWRRDWESPLDDVDAQLGKLAGDLQLVVDIERNTGRLLSVAERRVKDGQLIGGGGDNFAVEQRVADGACGAAVAAALGY